MSESQGTREKYIPDERSFASGRHWNMSGERERDSTRWEMAVEPRPSRSGALNFLWNPLTIKYELARSVILNFRMCPSDFVLPIRSECHPFPPPPSAEGTSDVERRSRDISIIFTGSRYLIFMKDSGYQTRSRRKAAREEMTTVYRRRRKKGKLGRKDFDGEGDFKALSSINPLRERWKILRQ